MNKGATRSNRPRPGNPGLRGKLLDKSIEAYVMALETINRLSVQYRVESFCYLLCNAWELLLKAKLLTDTGTRDAIYYPKERGMPRRTLSLRDALARVVPRQDDPLRRNLELMAILRDESVHLVIRHVPQDILCLAQACVLNFHEKLREWFALTLGQRAHVGMMSIIYDFDPAMAQMSSPRLRRELGKDAATFLMKHCATIQEQLVEYGDHREFFIGVDYKLALTKRDDAGDISLTTSSGTPNTAGIVYTPRDTSRGWPLRQKEVLEQLRAALPGIDIKPYDMQCVCKVHGCKSRPEFFYQGTVKGSPAQYSARFVEWVKKKYAKDPRFFVKARAAAKKRTG